MPLFSEHINNMYYSGTPSYSASPSYGASSYSAPYNNYSGSSGMSYSASYLNPGGNFSKHSSLVGYSRPPLNSRWTSSSRNYSPLLSTISERGSSSPVRISSPRRLAISKRTYVAPSYTPRQIININTADIDVSRNKYKTKVPNASPEPEQLVEQDKTALDDSPFMPRVDGKPKTGIDSSPGSQKSTIKRGRSVVRLVTIKRKDKESPPSNSATEMETNDPPLIDSSKDEPTHEANLGWREKLSDDLVYKDKREKKTLGAKLVEKFLVKDKEENEELKKDSLKRKQEFLESVASAQANSSAGNINTSIPSARRYSMELLAEQANVLDSLIRGENLSTATLDISKVGKDDSILNQDIALKLERRGNPLQTAKSDHSIHDRLSFTKTKRDNLSKKRSLKKSASGGCIRRLDSITEIPKESVINSNLSAIEESRRSIKIESKKPKLKRIPKITSSVEVSPPKSPLIMRVDDVVVEEITHKPRKEIKYSAVIDEVVCKPNAEVEENLMRNSKSRVSTRRKIKNPSCETENTPTESDSGDFWDTIGKRETVYLMKRKQNIQDNITKNRRALFWFPDDDDSKTETGDDFSQKNQDCSDILTENENNLGTSDLSNKHSTLRTIESDGDKLLETNSSLIAGDNGDDIMMVKQNIDNQHKQDNVDNKCSLVEDAKQYRLDNIEANSTKKQTLDTLSNSLNDDYLKDDTKEHYIKEETSKDISVAIETAEKSSLGSNVKLDLNVEEKVFEGNEKQRLSDRIPIELQSNIQCTDAEKQSNSLLASNSESIMNTNTEIRTRPKNSSVVLEKVEQPVSDKDKKISDSDETVNKLTITLKPKAEDIHSENNTEHLNNLPTLKTAPISTEANLDDETKNKCSLDNTTKPKKILAALDKSKTEVKTSNANEKSKRVTPKTSPIVCKQNSENISSETKNEPTKITLKSSPESSKVEIKTNVTANLLECKTIDSNKNKTSIEPFSNVRITDDNIATIIDKDCKTTHGPSDAISNSNTKAIDEKPESSSETNIQDGIKVHNEIVLVNIPDTVIQSELNKPKSILENKNSLKPESKRKTPKYGLKVPVSPNKPTKEEKAIRPLIATPRPLQKKIPQIVTSSSESESSSSEETSSEEESESSEGCGEFFECENNPDGRTSTGSNDSGFDSSAPTSPAGFVHIKKECDVNCHRKCEKLTANLCGVNQRRLVEALASRQALKRGGDATAGTSAVTAGNITDLQEYEIESSTAYSLFRNTGHFTPPAKSIPRFRKYVVDDFHFIKVLGKGSFGKVLLAELRDTEYYYAVKCLKKDVVLEDDDVECTLIERKVLALGTNHPFLCHLFATFQTDSHLFFVMEYLNGGDLMFHIQQSGRFSEAQSRFYAAEIVSGLKFLHKRGIVYRDLKLDNILLDYEGHVRIADFGMCKLQIFLEKTADTFCGTPDYMAPEIIKGLKYNQTVDWWSFGVLLYEMLIGQSPFSGCDEDELFWSICNEVPSYPRFLSHEALTILTRLLDKDARTRLGGVECVHGDIRDQDFFRPVHWDRLERKELDTPFKPRVRHPLDTQYFDRAFTGERPRLTAVEPQVLRSMDQTPFRGFSYTNPNVTDR